MIMELTIDQALQKAVEAHKAGQVQEAGHLYTSIIKVQPHHPDANHNMGVLAVGADKVQKALPFFKTALEANPKIEQFWLSYIDALIKEKQLETAKAVLEQGRKVGLVGDKVDALKRKLGVSGVSMDNIKSSPDKLAPAIKYREAGKFQEAQEWLEKLIESQPNHAEAHSLLCHVLLLDKKDVEAEQALLTAASLNSELASIYRNQARLLLKQSNPEGALKKAQIGYECSRDDPEGGLVLASCLNGNQRVKEALDLAEKVLLSNPNYAEAYATRALIRLQTNDIIGAIADAGMAVSLKPHLTQIWRLLGSLKYKNKNLSGAITALEKVYELEPTDVNCMVDLGEFLRQDNRVSEAITILEKAAELAPKVISIWINLGTAFQQDKQIDKAKTAYEKALAINPKLAEISNNLGSIAKDIGDWISALQHFEHALEISPNIAESHFNSSLALQELGRLKEAEVSFRQAIVLKPDYAEAHRNLGTMLQKLGRIDEAEASYRQAIAFKPDYTEAHNNLLESLYLLDKQSLFFDKLDYLINENTANATIGSLICRSALKYGVEKPNLFCSEPLKYILHIDMNTQYDFEGIFAEKVRLMLKENRISNRKQSLLVNGSQTSGNLFDIKNSFTEKIQQAIRLEIEKYRIKFKDRKDGLIRKWPTEYSLYGWLISMKSGGELKPHIHGNGWLSGSLYINVPPKSKAESGSLVVSLGEEKDATDSRINVEKIINVVTGSLVLFPASLTHYTIPFESEEERIVLAFDVIQK